MLLADITGDGRADLVRGTSGVGFEIAKNNGKNSYRFFTPEMQQQAVRHLLVETELHRALERNLGIEDFSTAFDVMEEADEKERKEDQEQSDQGT